MPSRQAKFWRGLAVLLLCAAWAVAAHYASAGHGPADFNTALGCLPLVFFAVVVARPLGWFGRGLLAAGFGTLLFLLWPHLRADVAWLYYLQHLGMHLGLAWLFGRSLFTGGDALITRIARQLHSAPLSFLHERYTRQVTAAWSLFLVANALISTLLFFLAPRAIWSIHANLLTWPLVALFFIGELLLRRQVLLPEERAGLFASIRAYRSAQSDSRPRS
ncbi:hypothetical protein [Azonexus sp.]|uniref:hypothetical protein n=1 Tax=Azonexus sp. TaxID=1872668 RepID=UPI0039E5C9E6